MYFIRYLSLLLASSLAAASAQAQDLSACRGIVNDAKRLECYDQLAGRHTLTPVVPITIGGSIATPAAVVGFDKTPARPGLLADWWGFGPDDRSNHFAVLQHYPNYVTAHVTNHINTMPMSPTHPSSGSYPTNLDYGELKFQLSAKARVIDLPWTSQEHSASGNEELAHDFGLWLAYTQQSYWQILNAPLSRPFLETNYQPEAILAFRPQLFFGKTPECAGIEWQLFNVGFVHQSNGKSDPLSRSWNRVYAEFGFETQFGADGDLAVLVRPWYRLPEQASKDDNPNITDFLGYGDVTTVLRKGPILLSVMARGNPRTGKGAGQLNLALPLWPFEVPADFPLKWFLQVFSGYGESLIDYNWRQTTVSVGLMLNPRR